VMFSLTAFPISTIIVNFLTLLFLLGIDFVLNYRNQFHVFARSLIVWKLISITTTFLMNKLVEVLETCPEATTCLSHCSILHHILGVLAIVCFLCTVTISIASYLGLIESDASTHRQSIINV
ncbi:hypothetical protein PENTCL1PPCAC_30136, partial [Pristionchus entomophagus]